MLGQIRNAPDNFRFNMKEISSFRFPKLTSSDPGISVAEDLTAAMLKGKESILNVYDNSNTAAIYNKRWCLDRFIIFKIFFDEGCYFLYQTNNIIDSSTFNEVFNYVRIEDVFDSQQRVTMRAIITAKEVVRNFILGEETLEAKYNKSDGIPDPKTRKQDHRSYLLNYYTMIDVMLKSGISFFIPDSVYEDVETDYPDEIPNVLKEGAKKTIIPESETSFSKRPLLRDFE